MSNAVRKVRRYAERHKHIKARMKAITDQPIETRLPRPQPLSGIIVYGAGCVWWDIIENAARTRPPSCPHCGSVLFQFDNEQAFWAGSAAYEKTHPGYTDLLRWLKGKCFKTMKDAAIAYEAETGIHYEVGH